MPNIITPPFQGYDQTVTVAKGGEGDYDSIQDAIDSITDASSSKRYAVYIYPGDYAENITMSDYIDLVGIDSHNSRITPTSGVAIAFGNNTSSIFNLGIYCDYGTASADINCITATGGVHHIHSCYIVLTKSGGDYFMRGVWITGGEFRMVNSHVDYTITGGVATLKYDSVITNGGATNFLLKNCYIDALNNDTNDAVIVIWASTGSEETMEIDGCCIVGENQGTGATAQITGLYTDTSNTGVSLTNSHWMLEADQLAYGLYLNATSSSVRTQSVQMLVTSTSSSAYSCLAASGNTWISHFDDVVAANGTTGAGTFTYATSFVDGEFSTSGDATIGNDLTVSNDANVSGDLDVTGDVTLGALKGVYQQCVTVAKSGGDYTTIQGAIDSITDASTTKRYVVLVYPGDYAENVTMKAYVDLAGIKATSCRITPTSGTVITFDTSFSNIFNMGIYADYGTLTANTDAISHTGGAHTMRECYITITKSGGDYVMNGLNVSSTGVMSLTDCHFNYDITGATTANPRVQSCILVTGSATFTAVSCFIDMNNDDTNDYILGFANGGGSDTTFRIYECIVDINNSGSGITAGMYLYSTATGCTINECEWRVASVGDCYGIYMDSTGDNASIYTYDNTIISSSSGGTGYACYAATGDTWNSCFDALLQVDTQFTGAGTENYVHSLYPGHLEESDRYIQCYDSSGGTDLNQAAPGVAVPWDAESFKDSMFTHSTATNPSRITVTRTGLYKVTYNLAWDGGAIRNVRSYAYVNGTTGVTPSVAYGLSATATDDIGCNTATFFVNLTANDYIEIFGELRGSAGACNSVANECWISVEFIR